MRLSSMADYAVVTMCAASRHCGTARVSAADLAEETGLPAPTVQKLVSLLSRAGLLRAVRGAGGGLKLARPAAAISLADIVEAVEGPIALTTCVEPFGSQRPTSRFVSDRLVGKRQAPNVIKKCLKRADNCRC